MIMVQLLYIPDKIAVGDFGGVDIIGISEAEEDDVA